MPSAPSPPAPAWLEAIDPALVARLRRPLDAAGIIPLPVVHRIVGWAQYFSGRLPMLDKLSRRRGGAGGLRAGDVPIVHARFAPPPPEGVMATKVIVERLVVRAAPPAAVPQAPHDSAAPAQLAASVPDRGRVIVPAEDTALGRSAPHADLTLPRASPGVAQSAHPGLEPRAAHTKASSGTDSPLRGQILYVEPGVKIPGERAEHGDLPVKAHGVARPEESRTTARPIETPKAGDLLPIVRPIVRDGGSTHEASSPARPETAAEPSIHRAASAPLPNVTASAPLPRVTPVRRTASDAAPSPASPLPHVRPGGARAGAGAASRPGSAEAFAAPESTPWTAPLHAAPPHGEPGSEPFRRRSGTADERSMAPPRAALSTTPKAIPLDVDTIVDKVQRKLLRRFAAEKERRGGLR